MKKQILIFLAVLAAAFLIGNALAGPIFNVLIPSSGNINWSTEIAVTWVSNSSTVDHINWGTVDQGATYDLLELINITNVGNVPLTLTKGTANHVNIVYLTVDWNYTTGTSVPAGDSVIVQLTQTVTTVTPDPFSYNLNIDATG